MKYRKKPVVVEAEQFDGTAGSASRLAEWCGGEALTQIAGSMETECVVIETLEGEMRAQPGDYIIQGIQGEFYPCKPDIFEATYERVESTA